MDDNQENNKKEKLVLSDIKMISKTVVMRQGDAVVEKDRSLEIGP